MLTQARLKERLHYDPDTGIFTWLNGKRKGRAGCKEGDGYIVIKVDRKIYKAHRLAFLYMLGEFPEHDVDHRDLNPTNNRWSNLRKASRLQNNVNIRSATGSVSKYVGVYFRAINGRWAARIRTRAGRKFLGYFAEEVDAAKAYHVAAKAEHGEFARGNPDAFLTEKE